MPADSGSSPLWSRLSYAYAGLVVAGFAYFLIDLPVQVSDSYGNLVKASAGTLGSLVQGEFHQAGYLRPLLWGQLRVVMDVSGGRYYEWFRGWHVAQIVVLALLFVHLVRPRRWSAAAALPLGLAALIGMHTFAGTVREAFPINTFMTILLCSLAAADLAIGPPRWWRDLAAALLFVYAALTVESGLLVAVIVVAARLAGARGVSWAGAAGQVLLVAGYLVLRFGVLEVGSPQLEERSSGFGFATLDPDDLIARFGGNPLPFYAYNVGTSLLSLFLSEPRGGVWLVTRDAVGGEWGQGLVNVIASALASLLILGYIWQRRREWLARRTDRGDQIVFVFVAVALANAVLCYAYTKDVILSPAGAFFALALTVATAYRLERASTGSIVRAAGVALLLVALSATWATRVVAAHLGLRHAAEVQRQEWAYVDQEVLDRDPSQPEEPIARRLKLQLQDDAVRRHPVRPSLRGDWVEWFGDE